MPQTSLSAVPVSQNPTPKKPPQVRHCGRSWRSCPKPSSLPTTKKSPPTSSTPTPKIPAKSLTTSTSTSSSTPSRNSGCFSPLWCGDPGTGTNWSWANGAGGPLPRLGSTPFPLLSAKLMTTPCSPRRGRSVRTIARRVWGHPKRTGGQAGAVPAGGHQYAPATQTAGCRAAKSCCWGS